MNTFLPYPDYEASAKALDTELLSLQRRDVIDVLEILHERNANLSDGWRNHPAVAMWRGHEPQLAELGLAYCEEASRRDIFDFGVIDCIKRHLEWATEGEFTLLKPKWFGNTDLHTSHQSALLRRDPDHYSEWFPGVSSVLPELWPEA